MTRPDESWSGTGDDGRFSLDAVEKALAGLGNVTVHGKGGDFELHRHPALDGTAGQDTMTIACRAGHADKAAETLRKEGYKPQMNPGGRLIVLRQEHHQQLTQRHHQTPPPGFKPIPDDPKGGYSRTDGGHTTYWHKGIGPHHGSA